MYNRWSWDNTANYIFNIDDHNIDILVGQSMENGVLGERNERFSHRLKLL